MLVPNDLTLWLDQRLREQDPSERETLIEYILSILTHAEPDTIRSKLFEELSDFLGDQTTAFVDDLLGVLGQGNESSATAVSAPAADGDMVSEDAPVSSDPTNETLPSQPMQDLPDTASAPASEQQEQHFEDKGARRGAFPNQRACRDFNIRGYCSRGESCRFSHAPPERTTRPQNGRSASPNQGSLASRLGQRDRSRSPTRRIDRGFERSDRRDYAPVPQPGRPESSVPGGIRIGPTLLAYPQQQDPMLGWHGMQSHQQHQQQYPIPRRSYVQRDDRAFASPQDQYAVHTMGRAQNGMYNAQHAGAVPHHAQQGRSHTRSAPPPFDLGSYDPNASIVIEQLPDHACSDEVIYHTFSPYGTVEAIQVDAESHRSLVVFTGVNAAQAAQTAHDDPKGFFNSRFVRVFFADGRDRPGHNTDFANRGRGRGGHRGGGGGGGGRGGGSFRPPGRGFNQGNGQLFGQQHGQPYTPSPHAVAKKALAAATTAVVDAKTQAARVQGLIGEQKRLMDTLTSTMSPEDKRLTMARLRELAEAIPPATQAAKDAQQKASQARNDAARLAAEVAEHSANGPKSDVAAPEANPDSERQRLDAELDAMAADRT